MSVCGLWGVSDLEILLSYNTISSLQYLTCLCLTGAVQQMVLRNGQGKVGLD